jgi:hypothetical protein
MRSIRRIAVLALMVGVVGSCTDEADRALTGPTGPRFAVTPHPEATQALIDEINAAINCVYASNSKERKKALKDFELIVSLNDGTPEHSDAMKDHVDDLVEKTKRLIARKTLTAACGGADIGIEAQELFNLLYLFSSQFDKIEAPDYPGDPDDVAVGVFTPGEELNLQTQSSSVHVPADAFDVSVLFTLKKGTLSPPYAPFNTVGTPIPPPYEFTISPNIEANVGWGRYGCVSHSEVDEPGTLQLFRDNNGTAVGIPSDDGGIICPNEVYAQISNPLLRGAYRLVSRITAPLQPRLLYAAQHRAIGGPGTSASVHMVVRLDQLYGTDGNTGNLLRVDAATGSGTVVGPLGFNAAPGLAVDPRTDVMYASRGGGNPYLYTVNPATGAATFVGNSGLGFAAIASLEFNAGGVLFAAVNIAGDGGTGADHLATLDKATGVATVIGPFGTCSGVPTPATGAGSCTIEGIEGIAFDRSGTLWGAKSTRGRSGTNGLYTINPATGTATFQRAILDATGNPPSGGIVSLVFSGTGTLFGGTATAFGEATDGGFLVTINPATGVFSPIGQATSGSSLAGLAFGP